MKAYRPIQYLGNKLRVLDEICDAADVLFPGGGDIADLFTGSTIVAQALADRGHRLTAVDSQLYCKVLATAFLSIDRKEKEFCFAEEIIDGARAECIETPCGPWETFVAIEDKLFGRRESRRIKETIRPASAHLAGRKRSLLWPSGGWSRPSRERSGSVDYFGLRRFVFWREAGSGNRQNTQTHI